MKHSKSRKIFNTAFGVLFGLATIVIGVFIGLTIYQAIPNGIGVLITIILGFISLLIARFIFNRVRLAGPLEFITHIHASPDLDNLEPTGDGDVKRRTPAELVSALIPIQIYVWVVLSEFLAIGLVIPIQINLTLSLPF